VIADLGGPGPACSALRVRRLAAGELQGVEQERTQAHVDGCDRCQAALREIETERAQLLRDVPFDAFAAGVAERLALPAPRRSVWTRFVPLAAAAALLFGIGLARLGGGEDGTRSKGAASARVFEKTGAQVRAVGQDGAVGRGALQVELAAGGRRNAVVLLVEDGEATVLYAGSASGARAAFEWTGDARKAEIVLVLSAGALDADAVRRAVALRGAKGAPDGSEVLVRPLSRSGP
jgi:hypothetical protein